MRRIVSAPYETLKIWGKCTPMLNPITGKLFSESPNLKRGSKKELYMYTNPENFIQIAQGIRPRCAFIFQNFVKFTVFFGGGQCHTPAPTRVEFESKIDSCTPDFTSSPRNRLMSNLNTSVCHAGIISQPFLYSRRQTVPVLYNRRPLSPQNWKNCQLALGDLNLSHTVDERPNTMPPNDSLRRLLCQWRRCNRLGCESAASIHTHNSHLFLLLAWKLSRFRHGSRVVQTLPKAVLWHCGGFLCVIR